ncbi:hypothetical protein EV122DRAFT_248494 [Schizophyllum commune]
MWIMARGTGDASVRNTRESGILSRLKKSRPGYALIKANTYESAAQIRLPEHVANALPLPKEHENEVEHAERPKACNRSADVSQCHFSLYWKPQDVVRDKMRCAHALLKEKRILSETDDDERGRCLGSTLLFEGELAGLADGNKSGRSSLLTLCGHNDTRVKSSWVIARTAIRACQSRGSERERGRKGFFRPFVVRTEDAEATCAFSNDGEKATAALRDRC